MDTKLRLNLEQVAALHDKMIKSNVDLVEMSRTPTGRLKVEEVKSVETLRPFPLTTSKQQVEEPAHSTAV